MAKKKRRIKDKNSRRKKKKKEPQLYVIPTIFSFHVGNHHASGHVICVNPFSFKCTGILSTFASSCLKCRLCALFVPLFFWVIRIYRATAVNLGADKLWLVRTLMIIKMEKLEDSVPFILHYFPTPILSSLHLRKKYWQFGYRKNRSCIYIDRTGQDQSIHTGMSGAFISPIQDK